MNLPSRKSAQFWVLMQPADERALDEVIDCGALGAVWESRGPGLWTPTYHASLVEALAAGGGTQAFLRLATPDGTPTGPIFQYLCGRGVQSDEGTLRAGRVAYKWLPATIDRVLGQQFQDLADAAFSATRKVTLPHVVTHDGRPLRGYRIGRDASAWYLADPWPVRKLQDMSTFATYRLKTEPVTQR